MPKDCKENWFKAMKKRGWDGDLNPMWHDFLKMCEPHEFIDPDLDANEWHLEQLRCA